MAALRASGANVKNDSGEDGILCADWANRVPDVKNTAENSVTKKSLIEIGFAILL